jgi:hypothetical protein
MASGASLVRATCGRIDESSGGGRPGLDRAQPAQRRQPERRDPDDRIVSTPPITTLGAVPKIRAATPLSKAPISFDEPMKMAFTLDTRPSRCSG